MSKSMRLTDDQIIFKDDTGTEITNISCDSSGITISSTDTTTTKVEGDLNVNGNITQNSTTLNDTYHVKGGSDTQAFECSRLITNGNIYVNSSENIAGTININYDFSDSATYSDLNSSPVTNNNYVIVESEDNANNEYQPIFDYSQTIVHTNINLSIQFTVTDTGSSDGNVWLLSDQDDNNIIMFDSRVSNVSMGQRLFFDGTSPRVIFGSETETLSLDEKYEFKAIESTDGILDISLSEVSSGITVATSSSTSYNRLKNMIALNFSTQNGNNRIAYNENSENLKGEISNFSFSSDLIYLYNDQSNGNIYCNEVYALSDDRLKHNESKIVNALETVSKINPANYYKTKQFYESDKIFASDEIPVNATYESGYIAQEIKSIPELSHLVHGQELDISNNPTPLSLNYTGVQPYLCKAIQELHAIVKLQQEKIEALESKIESMG